MTVQQPVLLIDAMNLHTRHFCGHPKMSSFGQPMGGVVGFLGALRALVEQQRPKRVIVVWEGGGSTRRRNLYPDYKATRRPQRLNRFYGSDIPTTVENRDDQVRTTVACLKHMPVMQLYVEGCEADDVIAYLCRTHLRDEKVTIVSSDKDYYQLLGENVRIWRPGRKSFIGEEEMRVEYSISPANFALAKAVCGDASDNIPGVKGVGFKTLATRFPSLAQEESLDVSHFMDEVAIALRESPRVKSLQKIVESRDLIVRNLKLVDLDGSMLGPDQRHAIDHLYATFTPETKKIPLIRELINVGLADFNVDDFVRAMTLLS